MNNSNLTSVLLINLFKYKLKRVEQLDLDDIRSAVNREYNVRSNPIEEC